MKEYGYIEDGYLRSRFIAVFEEAYKNEETGEIEMREVSIEEQVSALLKDGYKPVDEIDEKRKESEPGYYIKLAPYDAGERISYEYIKMYDLQAVCRQIRALKEELEQDDYKIIKSYEASLLGLELPYDMKELHGTRQSMRSKINELEELISKNS